MTKPDLFLFTDRFPSREGEYTFLLPELPHLAERFRVTLVPSFRSKTPLDPNLLPAGVTVDRSLTDALDLPAWARGTQALRSPRFFGELARHLPRAGAARIKRIAGVAWKAERVAAWAASRIAGLNPARVLLYAYWLDHAATGLALMRASCGDGPHIIARAHGMDLYDDREPGGRHPFRERTLSGITRLFAISRHGRDYLARLFPRHRARIDHAPLGIAAAASLARPSRDGVLRLLSCSAAIELKRVGAIVEALAALQRISPGIRFRWRHVGDGPLLPGVRAHAAKSLDPASGICEFPGALPNDRVRALLADEPADLFVHLSRHEGRPVAIMEALAAGVPVVATAVGGVPELVLPDRSGWLVRADDPPERVAATLLHAAARACDSALRDRTRRVFHAHCDAAVNHARFAARLAALMTGSDRR